MKMCPGARFCERCGERLAPERAEQQAVLGAEAVAERPEAEKSSLLMRLVLGED